jgi:predicted nucleic acid-binding protein
VERQSTKEKVPEKEEVLELLSPEEVIEKFERYIEKVLRSQRIMKSLKSSLIVRKFTKKLSEV